MAVGRVGLSNCLADGAGFLFPFAADDGTYVVVVRFEYDGRSGRPSAREAVLSGQASRRIGTKTRVYRWLETEASIMQRRLAIPRSTRAATTPKGRVYSSTDGLNYTFLFDHYNYKRPQTLNQGLDDSFYLATNRGPGCFAIRCWRSRCAGKRSWSHG